MLALGVRGSLFDLAVLAANLVLVAPLGAAMRAGGLRPATLLLAAWAALSLGAYLKRVPLQQRLAGRATPDPAVPRPLIQRAAPGVAFVLLVMLWGLGAALLMASGEEWARGTSESSLAGAIRAGGALVGWLPAALFGSALVAPRPGRTAAWRARAAAETAADLLLGFGVVVSLAFWEATFVPSLSAAEPGSWPMRLLLVLLLSVPFAVFYLAPRLLFLAEDYRAPRAWVSAALAMAPLAGRIVF